MFKGLGLIEGKYHIETDPNVTPVIHRPRKFAYSIENKLKDTLDKLERNKVITKVDKPTSWVNSLVVREKPDGSLRVCLEPRDLNRAIKREHFRIPTANELSRKLAGKSVFSIVDQKDGFWHIELDEPSSFLCTFNYGNVWKIQIFENALWVIISARGFSEEKQRDFWYIPGVEIIFVDIIIAVTNIQEP